MKHDLSIVPTADGSNTIWNEQIGEQYHSRNGALQESKHVFLEAGLLHHLACETINEVSILEVGFGTGLNYLLTADYCAGKNIKLNYTGIEAFPLTPQMVSQTGYDQYVSPGTWGTFLTNYSSCLSGAAGLSPLSNLQIAPVTLIDFETDKKFDIVYFDAFAVAHQPEMWDEQAISHTVRFLKPGGIFVTYAITGNLKRMLKALGLKIEKLPGAPGKREMLRGISP